MFHTARDDHRSPAYARRAKRYSRIRLAILGGQTALSTAALAWFALSGRSVRLRNAVAAAVPDDRFVVPAYITASMVGNWAVHLPLGLIRDQLVERRFALTKQTPRGWFADQVKGLVVNAIVGVPLGTAAFRVIRTRPRDWWVVVATATVPISVAFAQLAPVVLMPLFNRFEPLQDDRLEVRLRTLAERAGVAIAAVYQMDMSRQTEKPNAFFAGLGRTKRIVLSDTLLDRFDVDEIESVVAHELGHQVHGDIWRFLTLGSVAGYGLAYATNRLAPPLVRMTASRTSVHSPGDVAAMPLLALVGSLAGIVILPVMAAFSRAIETRTDRYALELTGNGDGFARALTKLGTDNLADPDPSRWVVFLLYSHPPIARRIADAETYHRSHDRSEANG